MAGKKGQHYLTEDERYIMEGMLLAGAGPTEIARKMGICRQTVYNEMKRGLYVHQMKGRKYHHSKTMLYLEHQSLKEKRQMYHSQCHEA